MMPYKTGQGPTTSLENIATRFLALNVAFILESITFPTGHIATYTWCTIRIFSGLEPIFFVRKRREARDMMSWLAEQYGGFAQLP